jgi:hypothetical protein
MKNPQDLEEAFNAASKAVTGFEFGKKADSEISLAEQIEALQVRITELITGPQPAVNYTTNYHQPPVAVTTTYVPPPVSNPVLSQTNSFLPPEQNPSVYYTPASNVIPPLNRPYENLPANNNNNRPNNQMRRKETVSRGRYF